MCGIYTCISKREHYKPSASLKQLLNCRGPDYFGEIEACVPSGNDQVSLFFTSSVLGLRGGDITAQPFLDPDSGSVLCWNGEAWRVTEENVRGNDGQAVFQLLLAASVSQTSERDCINAVSKALRAISGPFALVFFDKPHGLVFFCRDCLGRRSLLYNTEASSDSFQLASVADTTSHWKEVEAGIISVLYCHDSEPILTSELPDESVAISSEEFSILQFPWSAASENPSLFPLGTLNRAVSTVSTSLQVTSPAVQGLEDQLLDSLKLRVTNVPTHLKENPANVTVAVLFSGGLDCTVLARMAHDILPAHQAIDLLNVAFENPRVIKASSNRPMVKKGHRGQVNNEILQQTDLDQSTEISPYDMCPDRITGKKAFEELQRVCPGRLWRFVEINIPYAETISHRSQVISLIYPHKTEMDLSIAYALYFAARGTGIARVNGGSPTPLYTSPARVLLSGLGADELFGGYMRHETANSRHGFQGLIDELELDVKRLGKRNLGRDDRVISHWSREARFPYLDERLVKWALKLPVQEKCGFGAPFPPTDLDGQELDIEAGKQVLRLLAYKLGMKNVAKEKKRAIQFGARTAKMETGQTKGTSLIS